MAILYTKNTLYICKHEDVLIEEYTRLKHTLHTSLLRGMVQNLHSKGLSFKALFFMIFTCHVALYFQGFLQADE